MKNGDNKLGSGCTKEGEEPLQSDMLPESSSILSY